MLEYNPLIKTLAEAAQQCKIVRFFYNNKWREGEVYSFQGNFHDKNLGVHIRQIIPEEIENVKTFKVNRMTSVSILDHKFYLPKWMIDIDYDAIHFLEGINEKEKAAAQNNEEMYECADCGAYCSDLDIRCPECNVYFDMV